MFPIRLASRLKRGGEEEEEERRRRCYVVLYPSYLLGFAKIGKVLLQHLHYNTRTHVNRYQDRQNLRHLKTRGNVYSNRSRFFFAKPEKIDFRFLLLSLMPLGAFGSRANSKNLLASVQDRL